MASLGKVAFCSVSLLGLAAGPACRTREQPARPGRAPAAEQPTEPSIVARATAPAEVAPGDNIILDGSASDAPSWAEFDWETPGFGMYLDSPRVARVEAPDALGVLTFKLTIRAGDLQAETEVTTRVVPRRVYVAPNGGGTGSRDEPFADIGKALERFQRSRTPIELLIASGSYPVSNATVTSRVLSISGGRDPATWEPSGVPSVLNGSVLIDETVGAGTVIEHLTVRKDASGWPYDAPLTTRGSPTFRDVEIHGAGWSAAVVVTDGEPVFERVLIEGGSSGSATGLFVQGGFATIIDSTIRSGEGPSAFAARWVCSRTAGGLIQRSSLYASSASRTVGLTAEGHCDIGVIDSEIVAGDGNVVMGVDARLDGGRRVEVLRSRIAIGSARSAAYGVRLAGLEIAVLADNEITTGAFLGSDSASVGGLFIGGLGVNGACPTVADAVQLERNRVYVASSSGAAYGFAASCPVVVRYNHFEVGAAMAAWGIICQREIEGAMPARCTLDQNEVQVAPALDHARGIECRDAGDCLRVSVNHVEVGDPEAVATAEGLRIPGRGGGRVDTNVVRLLGPGAAVTQTPGQPLSPATLFHSNYAYADGTIAQASAVFVELLPDEREPGGVWRNNLLVARGDEGIAFRAAPDSGAIALEHNALDAAVPFREEGREASTTEPFPEGRRDVPVSELNTRPGWGGNIDAHCPVVDEAAGDVHHATLESPCVDTGTASGRFSDAPPEVDLDGDPRPLGSGFDIGPDEQSEL